MAAAKQELSRVVRSAAVEPQWIQNRDIVVAVVLGARDAEVFLAWKKRNEEETLGDALDQVADLARTQHYELEVPQRSDRANPLEPKMPRRLRKSRAR